MSHFIFKVPKKCWTDEKDTHLETGSSHQDTKDKKKILKISREGKRSSEKGPDQTSPQPHRMLQEKGATPAKLWEKSDSVLNCILNHNINQPWGQNLDIFRFTRA